MVSSKVMENYHYYSFYKISRMLDNESAINSEGADVN